MSFVFEPRYSKAQMLALVCFAMMLILIGYSMSDCKSQDYYPEAKRITADIASYHLGEIRVHKPFAYYILTGKCLSSYLLNPIALGDASRCDVFVNSYLEKCDDATTPEHVTYIFKSDNSWTAGRNLLYSHVKNSKKEYFYHIFMDDDVIPIYTDHVIDFTKAESHREGDISLYEHYIASKEGLAEGIFQEKQEKSAWRAFEDDLIVKSPAFAVTNLIRLPDGFESRHTMHKHWEEVCPKDKKMPWTVSALYFDELFIAFHREAIPLLLPYTTLFDHISWHISGIINIFRARALLYKHGMANYRITVINDKHRPYPRHNIPKDLIPQYLKADGKDLTNLIDERELDYENFSTWNKWETVFMHNKDLCVGPVKFPLWRHYRT